MQNVDDEIIKNIGNKTQDKRVWMSLGFDELQTMEITQQAGTFMMEYLLLQ